MSEETYVHGDRGRPRRRNGGKGGERSMVPRERPTSYYGRPIVKHPVWKPEIPLYFFFGGLAGASACLAAAATFAGRPALARRAWGGAFVGVTVSPVLLIRDLGRPGRVLYMLRMVKITSPMSLGAWLLAANGGATSLAAALNLALPRRRGGLPEIGAAALGAPLATYTAALITNTAIPAWSEARVEMPFVFASSAAASAAGAALLTVPADEAEPARALGIAAVAVEETASQIMHRRLGPLATAYEEGEAGTVDKMARALSAAGALALALGGGRGPGGGRTGRAITAAGGAMLVAGAVCKRWAVFKAGFASAADPRQTIDLQRERMAAEHRAGA
ncbi:MAG TPA: NrfD/PsrC family molybdoenzyme membrane anchor subunit [Solirubrobacterales bacterium]|nr:NrfD/PsrC family molybdoenzyme membrane anchor subunit [Solirubrobacterales bacterium]